MNLNVNQFAMCLGIGWSPDVIHVKFGLEEKFIVEINVIIGKMSLNEVIALMLAFGQQRFVMIQRPMMILVELIAECIWNASSPKS